MSRLQGLDALRGIAATLVLSQHLLSYVGRPWADAILSFLDLGKLGVVLFFLISGFVIPFSLNRGLRLFWVGRAFRLLPALWVSILFCLVLGAQIGGGFQLLANALMLTHTLGQEKISDPYWTLNWELYFYAIVAAAFALGQLKRPAVFGVLAVICTLLALIMPKAFYLDYMLIGGLLRMLLMERDMKAGPWACVALGSLGGILAAWMMLGRLPLNFGLAMLLPLPAFALLWNRLSHPALLWLGRISYSLYLFHLPLIETLARLDLPPAVFLGLSGALSLLLAAIVYHWVERPGMALGKRIISARLSNCAAEPGTRSTVGG